MVKLWAHACISTRIRYILLDFQSIMHLITLNYLLRRLRIPDCCRIVWYDIGGVWLLNDLRHNVHGGTAQRFHEILAPLFGLHT